VSASPWIRMLFVAGWLGTLLVVLRAWQRKYSPNPEVVRKLAHVGTGLVTLSLPYLFHSAWPVFLLCGLSIAGMLAIRLIGPLKQGLGTVLHGVARSSGGEIYFPVSVAILFPLAKGNVLLFVIPILILTFADAVAALTGGRYGLTHYYGAGGEKSAEGSVAFFMVAFLSTHVPLLLMTDTERGKTLLIGLCMGLTAMLLEAIAWRGLDNLFIPLGGFILLKVYLGLENRALISRVCVVLGLVILLHIFRRHATLDTTALLGAAFVGYVVWAVGGWKWLVPPLALFVSYPLLSPRNPRNTARIHDIRAVLCVSSAGLLWLYLSRVFGAPEYFFPFTTAIAAHLAIAGVARLRCDCPSRPLRSVLVQSILLGWSIVFLPYFIVQGYSRLAMEQCGIASIAVAAATLIFNSTQPGMEDCPTDGPRWFRQGYIVLVISAAAGAVAVIVNYGI
jgi:phytol kinase